MTKVISVGLATIEELQDKSAEAYRGTIEADGVSRGFSAAEMETAVGKLECRAIPSQSRTSVSDWFSYRFYLNGRQVAKSSLPEILKLAGDLG